MAAVEYSRRSFQIADFHCTLNKKCFKKKQFSNSQNSRKWNFDEDLFTWEKIGEIEKVFNDENVLKTRSIRIRALKRKKKRK